MTNDEKRCCVNMEKVKEIQKNMANEEVFRKQADFFKILGEPGRLKIMYVLLKGEVCVGELSESLRASQSLISHQLKVLRQNGLVKFRKQGRVAFYSLDDAHVEILLSQSIEHLLHQKNR